MPTIPVKTAAGVESGSAALDDHWFAIAPNVPVMHQVVVAQLAAARRIHWAGVTCAGAVWIVCVGAVCRHRANGRRGR